MALFTSSQTQAETLDDLQDCSGFSRATPGSYVLSKGVNGIIGYTPTAFVPGSVDLDPDGGLEENVSGELRIKVASDNGGTNLELSNSGLAAPPQTSAISQHVRDNINSNRVYWANNGQITTIDPLTGVVSTTHQWAELVSTQGFDMTTSYTPGRHIIDSNNTKQRYQWVVGANCRGPTPESATEIFFQITNNFDGSEVTNLTLPNATEGKIWRSTNAGLAIQRVPANGTLCSATIRLPIDAVLFEAVIAITWIDNEFTVAGDDPEGRQLPTGIHHIPSGPNNADNLLSVKLDPTPSNTLSLTPSGLLGGTSGKATVGSQFHIFPQTTGAKTHTFVLPSDRQWDVDALFSTCELGRSDSATQNIITLPTDVVVGLNRVAGTHSLTFTKSGGFPPGGPYNGTVTITYLLTAE